MMAVSPIDIVIEEKYEGPTIQELIPVLDEITDDPVKVRWTNAKAELYALESRPDRRFLLCVPDMWHMERAVAILGQRIKIEGSAMRRGANALVEPQLYDWRNFLEQARDLNPRHFILKLAADSIRKGRDNVLISVVNDLFLGGIDPRDADVMLRIRSQRMRRKHG